MKFDGDRIKGESTIVRFENWIDIDKWNWTLNAEVPPTENASEHPPGTRAVGVPSVLTFDKLMDRATTSMLVAMNDGDEMNATISMIDVKDQPFGLTIELTGARLIDYDASFKSEDKSVEVEESWTIDYRTIKFVHKIGNKTGATVLLERPHWATSDRPKGGAEDEILKLTKDLTAGKLNEVWALVQKQERKTS